MKSILVATLVTMIMSTAWGQGLPDDLHAMPIAESLPGHEWSYRQGLDFDVIHFQNANGNGLRFYMDVSTNDIQSSDYIEATIMGQVVKLFKKCESKKDCMYTATINSGIKQNGRDLFTQIWVKPESNDITAYIDWLSSLKFVSSENKS